MPDFQRTPSRAGRWVYYPSSEFEDVRQVDFGTLERPDWLLPKGGWWYGPIPQPPDEIQAATQSSTTPYFDKVGGI